MRMRPRKLLLPRTSKAFLRMSMRLKQLLIAQQSTITYVNRLALEAELLEFKTWAQISPLLRSCIGEQPRPETLLTQMQLLKILMFTVKGTLGNHTTLNNDSLA